MTHRLPQVLPGGRAVIFTSSNSSFALDHADIDVITLADGRRKNLVRGGTFGRYLASGHLTYINAGVLYAMPFDITRLEPRGKAVPVLHDVVYSPVFGSAQFERLRFGHPDLSPRRRNLWVMASFSEPCR